MMIIIIIIIIIKHVTEHIKPQGHTIYIIKKTGGLQVKKGEEENLSV